MTNEQEKSLEKIKRQILLEEGRKNIGIPVFISDLKNVLALIEEKDKQIDLMSEQLTTPIHSKKWVKEYFKRKVKEKEWYKWK